MVVRSDSTVVGGGCNVISVSKGASRWSKESTLCVGRQQVGGGKREGGCQQRGGGLHGGGLLGGGSRGGGGCRVPLAMVSLYNKGREWI